MIVVIGAVGARQVESGEFEPTGFAANVALAAAAAGSRVEVVSRLGEDPAGDAVLLGFARAGVGHVASLRHAGGRTPIVVEASESVDADGAGFDDVGRPEQLELDGGDVGLALRYLSDYRVIVLAHPFEGDVVREAESAAAWGPAHLIVVAHPGSVDAIPSLPGALVLSADDDADGTASRLGRYAAAVDAGEGLDTAYAVLTGANAES